MNSRFLLSKRDWLWRALGVVLLVSVCSHLRADEHPGFGNGRVVTVVDVSDAMGLAGDEIPAVLRPWIGWVLHGEQDRLCPFLYDNHAVRHCAWPGVLQLPLSDQGGRFIQQWQLHREGWVPLPGNARHWPQQISVDGVPVPALERDGRPAVKLSAGVHSISGRFQWQSFPERLAVPAEVGLISLSMNGAPVPWLTRRADGEVWLRPGRGGREQRPAPADQLSLQVYRRIIDDIPLTVETRMDLDVSGRPREVMLDSPLLEDSIPLELQSPLPARLEPDGRLRVQVRPGSWTLILTARHPRMANALSLAPVRGSWPQEEIWVFDARRHLRLVEVSGGVAIDPHQTRLPADWQQLPAYRVAAGEELRLQQVRRGNGGAEADSLNLRRQMWLDFDGGGLTVQDIMRGTMRSGWRLTAGPQLALGRVSVDGRDQLITRLPGEDRDGVEIRSGTLRVAADSRYPGGSISLPAVGWAHDIQQLATTLHLPPGWKLLAATGMDNQPLTWLQRWTLLDLFVVLITALTVGRLWGWRWTPLALLTLALIWHEPGNPPRLIWLNLLGALALLRVLPGGRLQRLLIWYRNLSILGLILIAIPFMIEQARIGLFPQLGNPAAGPAGLPEIQMTLGGEPAMAPDRGLLSEAKQTYAARRDMAGEVRDAITQQARRYDPDARLQTGPGVPDWQWQTVHFSWNGPVPRDQQMHLVLLSPRINLLLNILRIGLVIVLGLVIAGLEFRRLGQGRAKWLLVALTALPLLPTLPGPVAAAVLEPGGMPSAEMLQTLKQRLLEPPDCLPACAMSPRMQLDLNRDSLTLRLEYHAQAPVAVPLPARAGQWLPDYISLNGVGIKAVGGHNAKRIDGVRQAADGSLWLPLDAGIQQLLLRGPVPPLEQFQLPLPLQPHRIEVHADGWRVDGVHEDGVADGQLQFTRIPADDSPMPLEGLAATSLPPFVRIERTLRLGLDWYLDTRVSRVGSGSNGIVLEVPLLEGEAVLTEGIRSADGRVQVNLAAGQQQLSWRSSLAQRDELQLHAADTSQWVEIWRIDVDPIWHLEMEGIPPVGRAGGEDRWLPQWQPWPGERLTLRISRPAAVPGRTLTIDRSLLQMTPGHRATEASLHLTLRSSQAARHTLLLPEGAELQSVRINTLEQPLRAEGRELTLPVVPGEQEVVINWLSLQGIGAWLRTPAVDLGAPGVNNELRVALGQDRWILMLGGPALGPAIWFWGELVILLLLALGLARLPLTPLKGWQWLLLLIGLSQVPIAMGAVVVGWLLLLGVRGRRAWQPDKALFNVIQIGLVLLTLVALASLLFAIQQGLLGLPEMQIAGNQSDRSGLNWYQDRSDGPLPQAWVLSVPLLAYRLLMLAWALWLAFSLLRWLRWGWECYSKDGIWRRLNWPKEVDKRQRAQPPSDKQ